MVSYMTTVLVSTYEFWCVALISVMVPEVRFFQEAHHLVSRMTTVLVSADPGVQHSDECDGTGSILLSGDTPHCGMYDHCISVCWSCTVSVTLPGVWFC